MLRKVWRSWFKPKSPLVDQTTSSLRCWRLTSTWLKWRADSCSSNTRSRISKNAEINWRTRNSIRLWRHINRMSSIKRRSRTLRISTSWRKKSEIKVVMLMKQNSTNFSTAVSTSKTKKGRSREWSTPWRASTTRSRITRCRMPGIKWEVVEEARLSRRVATVAMAARDQAKSLATSTSKETRRWDEQQTNEVNIDNADDINRRLLTNLSFN